MSGKWIDDLTAATTLDDAARRVLAVRLEVVRDYLRLALHEADQDPEYVHQLRVGTRRATAALDIFSICISDKIYKSARKHLGRIRRAAGNARDWDVFRMNLAAQAPKQPARLRPAFDFLLGQAVGQRVTAQAELLAANADFPFAFEKVMAEVLHAVHLATNGMNTLVEMACPALGAALRELEQAATQESNDYEQLHRLRILGKRLRYAMEIFADCFAPEFRERHYPAIEEMQDILGRANDSHVAYQRLESLRERIQVLLPREWKRYRAGFEALLKLHDEQLRTERENFEHWWTLWRESGGEAALFALVRKEAAS